MLLYARNKVQFSSVCCRQTKPINNNAKHGEMLHVVRHEPGRNVDISVDRAPNTNFGLHTFQARVWPSHYKHFVSFSAVIYAIRTSVQFVSTFCFVPTEVPNYPFCNAKYKIQTWSFVFSK